MVKRLVPSLALLLALLAPGFAEYPDFLKAGSLEFDGNLMVVLRPDYAPLAGGLTESQTGDFDLTLDLGLGAGSFLSDGFSLALRPTLYWYYHHSYDSILGQSYSQELLVGLGLEATKYLVPGSSLALGLGGEFGFGVMPGLMELSNDAEDPDKGLDLEFWLEPRLGVYALTGSGFSPYAELGYRLNYRRTITLSDGSEAVYASGYSILDDVRARATLTLGLTWFMAPGRRFGEEPGRSYEELLDAEIVGK